MATHICVCVCHIFICNHLICGQIMIKHTNKDVSQQLFGHLWQSVAELCPRLNWPNSNDLGY